MKQGIKQRCAAILFATTLCATLVPGAALAVEDAYRVASTEDSISLTTQADGDLTVTPSPTSKSLTLTEGYAASDVSPFSVTATLADDVKASYADPTYQWAESAKSDGSSATAIADATSASYTVPTGRAAGTYYFVCTVTAEPAENTTDTTDATDTTDTTDTESTDTESTDTESTETTAETLTSSVVFTLTVEAASTTQDAPTGVAGTNVTIKGGSDGTITGVSTAMEYRLSTATSWTGCTSTTVTGLVEGTYEVRYAKTDTLDASSAVEITIGWDATSTVTIGNKAPSVTVSNLDDVALAIREAGSIDDPLALEFAVSAIDATQSNDDITKIKAVAANKELTYLGFTVTQTLDPDSTSPTQTTLTDLGESVLEIAVPYTTKDREGIVVYRVHDGKAVALSSLGSKPSTGFKDGTFYVGDGVVTIYGSKFSTYAIGYNTKANAASSSAATPATGDTLPTQPFVIAAAAAAVVMVVSRARLRRIW